MASGRDDGQDVVSVCFSGRGHNLELASQEPILDPGFGGTMK